MILNPNYTIISNLQKLETPKIIYVSEGTDEKCIDILWSSVENAELYKIYRKKEGETYILFDYAIVPSYSDRHVITGDFYYYKVKVTADNYQDSDDTISVKGWCKE